MTSPYRIEALPGQDDFEARLWQLRDAAPVVRVEIEGGLDAWVITRYAEGRRALRDPRLIKDLRTLSGPDQGFAGRRYAEDVYAVEGRHMLNSDGTEHTRLRQAVAGQLSAYAVVRRRPEMQEIATALLDGMAGTATCDLMTAYARPFPELVLGRILGIPDDRMPEIARLSRRLGSRDDPAAPPMRRVYSDLVDLIREQVTRNRPADEDSLIAAGLPEIAAGRLSRRELTSTVMMLIGAGTSSTTIAIAHAAATLMGSAAVLRLLTPDGRDELLRHHPPFPFSPWRFAREPVEIGDAVIPAGAVVFVLLAAVNRDPAAYADPDRLDPDRDPRPGHLTFGYGPHYCVGAHLARLEIEVALEALFDRYPEIRLIGPEPAWTGLLFDRTITALPVSAEDR